MRFRPEYTWKPIDLSEIPPEKRGGSKSGYATIIVEFVKSGVEAGEVDVVGMANPSVAASCLRGQITRLGLGRRVKVLSRRRRVFLVKVTS